MKYGQFDRHLKGIPFASAIFLLAVSRSGSVASAEQRFSMKGSDGTSVVEISIDAHTSIQAGKIHIGGKVKDSETIKYAVAGAQQDIKVKLNENGFKLKDDGKLLWKTKFKQDKITVSNNEENEGPCVLKAEGPDLFRVYEDEKIAGTVRYTSAGTTVTASDGANPVTWRVTQPGISAAGGIILCGKIPEAEKFIIMAEFIRAGK